MNILLFIILSYVSISYIVMIFIAHNVVKYLFYTDDDFTAGFLLMIAPLALLFAGILLSLEVAYNILSFIGKLLRKK